MSNLPRSSPVTRCNREIYFLHHGKNILSFSLMLSLIDSQTETGLPADWEVRHSNSKNLPYYFNSKSRESRWDPPEGTDTETLKTYMAQNHSSTNTRTDGTAPEGKTRAAHLLVKHNKSRKPVSWREPQITRSLDEVKEILRGYEQQIRSGQTTLGDLAVTESDRSSARKRGDLGFFGRKEMQKEFEDAALLSSQVK
jgi:peptidyl-prolyl cis-trans isomerase NIMA-interacting 1